MSARAFEFGCRDCSFSNRGIKKQAVFPEPIHSKIRSFILEIYFSLFDIQSNHMPVFAIATTFRPSKIIGMVFR